MELATKRSLIQTHSSHASGSGTDEGTGDIPRVPDVPTYASNDEQISWKSSDKEDDDEVAMSGDDDDADNQEDDDNDDDDQNDDNTDNENDDNDDEESDESPNGRMDVDVNLDRRDTKMTNAPRTIIQSTQVIEDTHVIITSINPEDVLVTTIAETPLSSATTLPSPTIPLITHLQQTPIPTPITVSSSSLQDLPNFGIVDAYLANKMHEAVKTAVQLQSDRLRDEAQAENANFINKLDDNIKKIIKDQVKEQTSHPVAANLSELELKKILIDKMESNKSIHRSDEQKNLYKSWLTPTKVTNSYLTRMEILSRSKDIEMIGIKTKNPLLDQTGAGKSTKGSKSHHKSAGESAQAEEPKEYTAKDLEEPAHQEFETGVTEDQPDEETSQLPDWFPKPAKPPTPDRDWNKTLPDTHGPV
ncbi:hypothetical protein Tco_0920361 [Tanacetum coccineum]